MRHIERKWPRSWLRSTEAKYTRTNLVSRRFAPALSTRDTAGCSRASDVARSARADRCIRVRPASTVSGARETATSRINVPDASNHSGRGCPVCCSHLATVSAVKNKLLTSCGDTRASDFKVPSRSFHLRQLETTRKEKKRRRASALYLPLSLLPTSHCSFLSFSLFSHPLVRLLTTPTLR